MRDLVRFAPLALVMSVRAEAQPTLHVLLDSAIHAEAKNGFSGAVLVTRGGTIVLDKTYGPQRGTAETPARFWIASAAKQFTSVAILYCKEKGMVEPG
jgi:CubicO group peptidase (beta-lactamase class C family)